MKCIALQDLLKTLLFPFLLICGGILCFPLSAFAAPPLILDGNKTFHPANLNLDLLEDQEKQWTIEEVSSPEFDDQFVPNQEASLNLGYTTSAYWARLTIKNKMDHRINWLIEVGGVPTILDSVKFYLPNESGSFIEKKQERHCLLITEK